VPVTFFEVVATEKIARTIVEARLDEAAAQRTSIRRTISLEDFFQQREEGGDQTLRLIIKADVQGSLEPIVNSLKDLGAGALKTKILLEGTGNISESDANLAVASGAIIVGFNVTVDPAAQRVVDSAGLDVRLYRVIYQLIDDIDKALKGLLAPEYADQVIGKAEVRAVFKIGRKGKAAGLYVLEGKLTRNAGAKLYRGGRNSLTVRYLL
jgi:translation initiation factor IF-2